MLNFTTTSGPLIYLYYCLPGLCFYGPTCLTSPWDLELHGLLHCTLSGHSHQGCHYWREVSPGEGPRRTHAGEPHSWLVIVPDRCSQHIPFSWSPLAHPLGETTMLTFSRIQHLCWKNWDSAWTIAWLFELRLKAHCKMQNGHFATSSQFLINT